MVDFEVLLGRDAELAAREGSAALLIRDRALGSQLPDGSPHRRLRSWLKLRRSSAAELPGDQASGLLTLVGWALLLFGVVAGAGCGTALLAYDGRSPINVLAWLLYVAGVPFALAVVLGIGLLIPQRWLSRAGPAQALLGSLLHPLLRRLPESVRWSYGVLGRGSRNSSLERWLLVGLTQVFTLGFLLAALATLVVKVMVTDLTFSWSTTLELSDPQVTQLVRIVAQPWVDIFPGAVPDAEAVAQSNFQRYINRFRDHPNRAPVDLRVGAMWWKLCAVAVVVYGVIPRILLLLLAIWRWRVALARWPALNRPDVRALLDRFEDSGGIFAPRLSQDLPSSPSEPANPTPQQPEEEEEPTGPQLTVAWGAAATDRNAAAAALNPVPTEVLSAGADLNLEAEEVVLSTAAENRRAVQILMPLSEPPIEDVLSFLRELKVVAPAVDIVPLERIDGRWRHAPIDGIWRRALDRVQGIGVRQP